MPSRSVEWHDEWLFENCLTYESYQKLTDDYNKLFSDHVTKSGMRNHCAYKLGLKKPRQNVRHYTEEQREWLSENLPKLGRNEACRIFNEKFGENRTVRAMKTFSSWYGAHVSKDVWKTHVTENLNKNKVRDVGSVRIDHGRPVIKVAAGEKWQYLNRYVYESEHGKIPKGYCIVHLDNNPLNCEASNLAIASKAALMTVAGANMKSDNPYITKTALAWGELKREFERSMKCDFGK